MEPLIRHRRIHVIHNCEDNTMQIVNKILGFSKCFINTRDK